MTRIAASWTSLNLLPGLTAAMPGLLGVSTAW